MKKTFLKQRTKLGIRKTFSAFLIFFFCLSFLTPVFIPAQDALAIVECLDDSDCGAGLVCDMGTCVSDEPEVVLNPTLDKSCGIDMVLIMDSSSSMYGDPLQEEKDAFEFFVDSFLPNTPAQMAVVNFGTTASLLQGYTGDIDDLKTAINSVAGSASGEFTNWKDALSKAHAEFDNRIGVPDLYVFASDGNPYYGGATSPAERDIIEAQALADAIAMADTIKLAGVRIVTLGIGDNVDVDKLKAISSDDAYYASDFGTLADDLSALADDLCGGTVTVKKFLNDEPADDWVFSTLLEGGVPTTDIATTSNGGFATFEFDINETSAVVALSETSQDGYILDSAVCTIDDEPVGELVGNTVGDIKIGRNDFAYCEFKNITDTTPKGSITINKVTSTSTDILFEFDGTLGTTTLADEGSKTYEKLATGLYTFYEVNTPQFWYNTAVDCGNASTTFIEGYLDIDLKTDENVTCTFTNSYQPPTPEPKGSISGCKYNDVGDDGGIEGDDVLGGWTIVLEEVCQPIRYTASAPYNTGSGSSCFSTTTVTEIDETLENFGCYEFSDLSAGNYTVREYLPQTPHPWRQTYPANEEGYNIELEAGEATTTIDFANYQLPYCGDGSCNNEETCSSCSEDCTSGCGSEEDEWCGDGKLQTSRGETCDDGNTNDGDGCDNNCQIEESCGDGVCDGDETCSTCSSDCGSCSSGGGGGTPLCILRGDCGGSTPETTTTAGTSEEAEEEEGAVVVLGEEGVSDLTITKGVNISLANPGDVLGYTVLVTNNGNLDAFAVMINDELPEGLAFVEDESTTYTWDLGDIPAGESRDINYQVKVLDTVSAGTYTNMAVASSDNNDDVSASVDVEVVLVAVLAETGIDFGELAFLFIFSMTAVIGGRIIRIESLA